MTAPAGAVTSKSGSRVYPVQGVPMPSANSVLSSLDRPAINGWKAKNIAKGVAADPHLQKLALEGKEWAAQQGALDAVPSDKADLGTAVHLATEIYDRFGCRDEAMFAVEELRWEWTPKRREWVSLDSVAAHLDQWILARRRFGIVPVLIEATVCHATAEYAGTMDRAVEIDLPNVAEVIHPGCRLAHVLDVKTGAKVWPDVALQIVGYARATHRWNAATDTVAPLDGLCPDVGIVAALHEDACKVHPLDLRDAWPTFSAALLAWRWQNGLSAHVVGDPLLNPGSLAPW